MELTDSGKCTVVLLAVEISHSVKLLASLVLSLKSYYLQFFFSEMISYSYSSFLTILLGVSETGGLLAQAQNGSPPNKAVF